jgi:hypothetical protein
MSTCLGAQNKTVVAETDLYMVRPSLEELKLSAAMLVVGSPNGS